MNRGNCTGRVAEKMEELCISKGGNQTCCGAELEEEEKEKLEKIWES